MKRVSEVTFISIVIITICFAQLWYKMIYEEPYPSLCYPAFAKQNLFKNIKDRYSTGIGSSFNREELNSVYSNDSLMNLVQRGRISDKDCSFKIKGILEGGRVIDVNETILFKNLPLSPIAKKRTFRKKFWRYPDCQSSFFRKGAPYSDYDLARLEKYLRDRFNHSYKSERKGKLVKRIEVWWTLKKSGVLLKRVTINVW